MLQFPAVQVPDHDLNNEPGAPTEFGSAVHVLGVQRQSRVVGRRSGARGVVQTADAACLADRVRQEIRRRKSRASFLGIAPDIFSMPAWEILLELLLAELTGQKNQVTTVGLDTGIPQSTVQRWLAVLENLGLVQRRRDRTDKRRQWVGLTARARQGLLDYFQA